MLALDVAVKTFRGHPAHMPVVPPISTYIVKISELCNLNCTYCYMYNLKDFSFARRPKRMSTGTRDNLTKRIREHAARHGLKHVTIIMHGGEPLLVGKAYFEEWATAVREGLGPDLKATLSAQTNGVLIDQEWTDLLRRLEINVGVSIDGPKALNDKYRVDRAGRGTFENALEGLRCFIEDGDGPRPSGCVMSVASPEISAAEMWQFWINSGAKKFDFLLPHYTHDNPPPFDHEVISRWMVELFDLWWDHDDPDIEIRYFLNIINLILGSQWSMDYLGGKPLGLAVIESDGAVTGLDSLRACANGLIELGVNVNTHSLDEASAHPMYRICNHPGAFISKKCARCRVRDVCGNGLITHRYSRAEGFNNPSIYCESLLAIISHVEKRVLDELCPAIDTNELVSESA